MARVYSRPGLTAASCLIEAEDCCDRREPWRRSAGVFMRALLSNPRSVGACCPSSPRLARAVAAAVDVSTGLVVELGGGTGAITSALLMRGVPPDRLVVVERDPILARHLQERFRGVSVIRGDAVELARLLAHEEGRGPAATVVSSLPMISLSRDEVRTIGAQICAVLERGGVLVQYTYQIALGHARVPGCCDLVAKSRVWVNLPPARVEVYRHSDCHAGDTRHLRAPLSSPSAVDG
jgi:phospholipid N-methyltransferase